MDDKVLMPPPKFPPLVYPKYPVRSPKQWRHEQVNCSQVQYEDSIEMNRSAVSTQAKEFPSKSLQRNFRNNQPRKFAFQKAKKKKYKKKKVNKTPVAPLRSEWNLADAELALSFESEYNQCRGEAQIKLELPDEPQDRDTVKRLHPNLKNVIPLQATARRFCYIGLRPGADVNKVIADLNSKPLPEFNGRCPIATLSKSSTSNVDVKPEDIDPYTVFIGNLPYSISPKFFIKEFPNKKRLETGCSRKVKQRRYVFVRFRTLNESIEAFKKALTFSFDSRDLIIRFKRNKFQRDRNEDSSSSISDGKDTDMFRFRPEFMPESHDDYDSQCEMEFEDVDSDFFDPDEYDLNEIYPAPRAPRLPLVKYLRSEDDSEDSHVTDYDLDKNLPIVPEDLASNTFTESLHDLDSPF